MKNTFTEKFLTPPPPNTVRVIQTVTGTTDNARIWVGYNANGRKTCHIYCPYRIGSRIPEPVTAIEAIFFDNHWRWRVTTAYTAPRCPNCGAAWDERHCEFCGLSLEDPM
jgi:hypothetical protein